MTSPFEFLQQVRAEGEKVTWPTRRETLITTAMVFLFALMASLFFFVSDHVIRFGMSTLLNFLR
jgi:preprotein translocase subunit SecE